MSIYNLDKVFRPATVAVVGASNKEGSLGYALMHNLLAGGFQGSLFPVNPHYGEVSGLRAYSSLSEIKGPVDLAVIAVPIAAVPSIIRECGELGVPGAVVVSAGGMEAGHEGKEIEEHIKELAIKGGVRIIGPNCVGVVCTDVKLNAGFAGRTPLPGKLAFVSQSGAICSAILDISLKEHIGFSYFVSIGSMVDVDFGDLVNYFCNDPKVSSIVLYIENLSNFRKFMSAARATSRIKPIVVLKSGRSPVGARAVSSHTGAPAGEDAVYDAAFQRAGIVRVDTIEELFDCAGLLAKQPRPAGSGMAVITNAGGPGVMAADRLASYGMEPAALSRETMQKLDEVLPPHWSRGNPIDVLGDASADVYCNVVRICMSAPEINSILMIFVPQFFSDPTETAASLTEILKKKRSSVFTVWMGAEDVEKARDIFNRASIPTYETPERAITAFQYLCSYTRNQEMLRQIPQKLQYDPKFDRSGARNIIHRALERQHRVLTELESKALLSAYGIPSIYTDTATSAAEAIRLAQEIGYPVVLKIHSRDIPHKSDANGVERNLKDDTDVAEAFDRIMSNAALHNPNAELLGVTVQPMLQAQDYELMIGCKKDRDFGPVILFGMGGIMTEVIKDQAIALPPLNRLLARGLIEDTKVYQLLRGYRNRSPANLVLLEEILVRLSQLVADFSEIEELDINPMIMVKDRAYAMDARVVVGRSAEIPAPLHMVISSYPAHYESTTVTKGGVEIFIRPIRPEDAPLLVDLFNDLSPTSIYYRFLSPLKSLSPDMLARFTQVDYDRDIALVAIQKVNGEEKMLAVARLLGDPDGTEAEFAIVVGDPWQGKGVGAALLERCISIAAERGMRSVWGIVLPENTQMLALGRKLGFKITRPPGGSDYELRIDLNQNL